MLRRAVPSPAGIAGVTCATDSPPPSPQSAVAGGGSARERKESGCLRGRGIIYRQAVTEVYPAFRTQRPGRRKWKGKPLPNTHFESSAMSPFRLKGELRVYQEGTVLLGLHKLRGLRKAQAYHPEREQLRTARKPLWPGRTWASPPRAEGRPPGRQGGNLQVSPSNARRATARAPEVQALPGRSPQKLPGGPSSGPGLVSASRACAAALAKVLSAS